MLHFPQFQDVFVAFSNISSTSHLGPQMNASLAMPSYAAAWEFTKDEVPEGQKENTLGVRKGGNGISFQKYLMMIRMPVKLYSPIKFSHNKQHEGDLAKKKNEENSHPEHWLSTGKRRRADDSTEVH